MKLRTTCCLGMLLLVGSSALAQPRNLPPPNTTCDGSSTLAEWVPQFHFDHCLTGYNPYEVILSPANVGNLVLDWQYTTAYPIDSSPAVANGVVYVGAQDSNVYALNAATGAKLWIYNTLSLVQFFADGGQWGGLCRLRRRQRLCAERRHRR